MAPKKAKGKQKQEEKQSKAVHQGVTLVDPPVVDSSAPYIPGQEDRWGANVHQEIHNWPDVQPPTIMITVPVSDTASGHMPTNRLSASGVVNEGFDSWGVNDEGTENPQTWDTHQSQTSTITAAPSAIASPISHPVSLSAAAALLDTQKTSSASEAARRLEAKHGMSSHHDPWPSSSNPQGPSHPVPAHRDKVPTSSAMKHPVQQQPNVWRDYKAPSSVQGRTNEGSWGQPHGSANVNWGQTKASSSEHHQQGQPQRRVVQSWETWGKTPNSVIRVMPPSPESSSEDSDEYGDEEDEWETVGHQAGGGRGQPEGNFGQTAGSWGETGGGWGQGGQGSVTWGTASPAAQHKQADWGMWGAETKRLPKVTFAPSAPDGSRNILSPQQRSQILNSLLNLPQSQNTKAGQTAQHQHQHQQKQKAQNQPANNKHTTKQQSQPQWGAEDGWGTQEQSSKKKKKQQQQQPQAQSQPQWGSWGEEAGWGNPEQASDKKSKKRKDQRSVPGDENSWGAAEHGDKKSGRNQQTEGQWGSWGAENAQGTRGNKKSKLNPDHDSHNGNWGDDDWGAAGHGGKGGNKRQDDANGAWGSWGDDAGWGAIQEETEDEETEDTHHDHSTAKNVWSGNLGDNTYSMPSKTLTHAYKGTTTTLHTALPRSSLSEHANIQFLESKGVAFQPVTNAFFGTTRLARERIHWMFPSDKDERVASLLIWIQTVSYNLGAFGLHRFLQSRERGALFANAAFRLPDHPKEPVFDWLTFDQLQASKDRTLQESVAFYDPAVQVIVFVYLPSQSGNSVAIWRRKIIVPNNVRLVLQAEINVAMAALRREKDYVVHVDEPQPHRKKSIQTFAKKKSSPVVLRKANAPHPNPPKPPKKKRKWWNIFG